MNSAAGGAPTVQLEPYSSGGTAFRRLHYAIQAAARNAELETLILLKVEQLQSD
jgi:hypothetical protein